MSIYVGERQIKDTDVFAEMQYQESAQSLEEACFLAARSLVIKELLLSEALQQKVDQALEGKSNDDISQLEEQQLIDSLIKTAVPVPELDEDSCEHYYDNNKRKFIDKDTDKVLPFKLVASHIKEYLLTQSLLSGISEYIQVLASNTEIKGFDFNDPSAMMINLEAFNGN